MNSTRMIHLVFIVIIVLALVISYSGIAAQNNRLSKEIEELFEFSGDISSRTFDYDQLKDLPEPVQNYFRYALKEGQPYISYVRLKHRGFFKTAKDKKWTKIKGEQYFTAQEPGFLWKGKTSLFTARDMYIGGRGRLVVALFSLFKVVDETGAHLDQAELLRWLGESIWFPTNLLPSDRLKWTSLNDHSARVTLSYKEMSVYYDVTFNEKGEIVKLETERFMEKGKKEKWIGKVGGYNLYNGVRIPTTIKATWKLKEGDYPYADFKLETIEYDIPGKF